MESLNGSGKQFPKVQGAEDPFDVDWTVNYRIERLRASKICVCYSDRKKTVYKWTSDRIPGFHTTRWGGTFGFALGDRFLVAKIPGIRSGP